MRGHECALYVHMATAPAYGRANICRSNGNMYWRMPQEWCRAMPVQPWPDLPRLSKSAVQTHPGTSRCATQPASRVFVSLLLHFSLIDLNPFPEEGKTKSDPTAFTHISREGGQGDTRTPDNGCSLHVISRQKAPKSHTLTREFEISISLPSPRTF